MARFLLQLLLCLASFGAWAKTQPQDVMAAGEGAVLFHESHNYPRQMILGNQMASFVSVERVDLPKPAIYYLEAGHVGFQVSHAYVGSLPAGRYRFRDFTAAICSILCGKPVTPPPVGMPEFEVAQGEVSYLGTLFVSITGGLLDKREDFQTRWGWNATPDLATGQRLLAGSFPEMAASSRTVRSGWVEGEGAAGTPVGQTLFEIRSNSAGMYPGSRWGADGFYFGAQNGVVKRWRPGGNIELLDTATDFMVASVADVGDGTIVAAGEGGMLRVSTDDGRSWNDRTEGLPFGAVGNLLALEEKGQVAFTVNLRESVAVFRGSAAAGAWQKVGEFKMKFATWTGIPGVQPQMFRHQSRLVLTLPSRRFAVIDLATGDSEERVPPGSISNFKVSPDGTLWCTCAKTIAFSPYLSRDLGKTWEPSDISRFMVLPEFFDSQRAFSYQGAIFTEKKTGISITADGGKTWQFTHEPELNMAWWSPAYSADGTIMLLHSVQVFGNVAAQLSKYTRDNGQTWERVPATASWTYPVQP